MRVCVVGTGQIGATLGRAMAEAGHEVVFGSRHPSTEQALLLGTTASVRAVSEALEGADAVVVAVPGPSVADFAEEHRAALAGALIVDAANTMGAAVGNHAEAFGPGARYARAFNSLGVENFVDPGYPDGPADLFFSAPAADRQTVAELIEAVGLHPVYTGEDPTIVDGIFRLWVALVMGQGHSRHSALRLIGR